MAQFGALGLNRAVGASPLCNLFVTSILFSVLTKKLQLYRTLSSIILSLFSNSGSSSLPEKGSRDVLATLATLSGQWESGTRCPASLAPVEFGRFLQAL